MLKNIFEICDLIFQNCDRDFFELENSNIDSDFCDDYNNIRLVNSFLFNFSKLQYKIGTKLFKKALYELKEIDNNSIAMVDVLNILERLKLIDSVDDWDELREIRNLLAHEYPMSIDERIENIKIALNGYKKLKIIYNNIKAKINAIK